jgi:K+-transporting ATPase KdpF subunit
MKLTHFLHTLPKVSLEMLEILQAQRRRQPFAFILFTALCLNVMLAPVVYAATGEALTRQTTYAIGVLLLVTIGLSIYLFTVIFQPERF